MKKYDKNKPCSKKYSVLSNIWYALVNIWRWDKAFYLYFIPKIAISVLIPLATTYFPKVIIDAIELDKGIIVLTSIICLYFCGLFVVDILNSFCTSKLDGRKYNISNYYQHAINEKHMRTDYSNTDNPEANIKYQNAMGDACSGFCAPEFIWQSLLSLIISFLGIFTYGSIIASVSPWILILLFISAILNYIIGKLQRDFQEKHKDERALIDRKIWYLSSFSEKFEYAKDIRVYGMIGWISGLLSNFQKESFSYIKKISFGSFLGNCANGLMTLLRDGLTYSILIFMVINGKIGAGDFVFYFGAIVGFSAWLNGIVNNINDVIHKGIVTGYYREYFDIEDKFNHEVGCRLPDANELPVEIEFKNVSYRYASAEQDKYALKNINLKIKKGEKLAIVGANGAGKTTLVKLMCGFYYPTEGDVKLNGLSISDYNIEDYYSLFSAVFQDIYLLPVTIAEFIASTNEMIDRDKVKSVICQAGLEDKVNSLAAGIDSKLMKGVFDDSVEMSGGEKQKLMLARALYKDSPVIVLDEPTAALDPIAENELYLKYSELTKNKTSIYISHRLASTRFCDRIIYIENGEIVEIGSHDELMLLGGKYAYMYGIQSHYYKEDIENA